jgi:hypothetical protein
VTQSEVKTIAKNSIAGTRIEATNINTCTNQPSKTPDFFRIKPVAKTATTIATTHIPTNQALLVISDRSANGIASAMVMASKSRVALPTIDIGSRLATLCPLSSRTCENNRTSHQDTSALTAIGCHCAGDLTRSRDILSRLDDQVREVG